MKYNKTDLIIYILGIISILSIIITVKSTIFSYSKKGSNDNIIITKENKFVYEKVDKEKLTSNNLNCIYQPKPVTNLKSNNIEINKLPWIIHN